MENVQKNPFVLGGSANNSVSLVFETVLSETVLGLSLRFDWQGLPALPLTLNV